MVPAPDAAALRQRRPVPGRPARTRYRPYQSVNFVTSHDGFCLYDLVSYNRSTTRPTATTTATARTTTAAGTAAGKGTTGRRADVLALRRRQVKNFCCLLLLANGTPMSVAGDEFMHTQGGNNNPYNQDNETTWLDWDRLGAQPRTSSASSSGMIAFRKAHPSICRSRFWRDDVRWYGVGPRRGHVAWVAHPGLSPARGVAKATTTST